jgi:hypothetical protein
MEPTYLVETFGSLFLRPGSKRFGVEYLKKQIEDFTRLVAGSAPYISYDDAVSGFTTTKQECP